MRRIIFPKPGPPEVIRVEEGPDPQPQAGEVRVRVTASGINFADIMARMGLYPDAPPFPNCVGYEVSGTIDAVGEGVTGRAIGDEVLAMTRFGGYSDVLCVPEMQAVPVPEGLDLVAAAGLPVTYLTAWLMLIELGNLRAEDTVLVHSAGGGVGLSALQICKWRGAKVIGTASAGKHARLREMGVDHCIDYRNQDFEVEVKRITDGQGVDIALDALGGENYKKSYRSLTDLGRLFVFGASSFAPKTARSLIALASGFLKTPKFSPFDLMDKNRGVIGANLGHLWHRTARMVGMIHTIAELAGQGILSPVIDSEFSFDQAAEAHAYIQARKNFGKVLLRP